MWSRDLRNPVTFQVNVLFSVLKKMYKNLWQDHSFNPISFDLTELLPKPPKPDLWPPVMSPCHSIPSILQNHFPSPICTPPTVTPFHPRWRSLPLLVFFCLFCPFWCIPIVCHHTCFSHRPCSPQIFLSAVNQPLDKDSLVLLWTAYCSQLLHREKRA